MKHLRKKNENNENAESYLAFFKSMQSIEDVLKKGQEATRDLDAEIDAFRTRMEEVIDETIRLSAMFGWKSGFRWGGFTKMFDDFGDLAARLSTYYD